MPGPDTPDAVAEQAIAARRQMLRMRPVDIPMRTSSGLNAREHPMARSRRVKHERGTVAWMLAGRERPALPCVVTLTRVAPSNGLDDDNLAGSLKAVRDQVAAWLGVDDKHSDIVRYAYAQERGPWGVRIEWGAA